MRKSITNQIIKVQDWDLLFVHKSLKLSKKSKASTVSKKVTSTIPTVTPIAFEHDTPQMDGNKIDKTSNEEEETFPPSAPSKELLERIINEWVSDIQPQMIEEAGCQVCGLLKPVKELVKISNLNDKIDLSILETQNDEETSMVTRLERESAKDPVKSIPGPVLDKTCDSICNECLTCLKKKTVPKLALSRGMWVGEVPEVLSCLSYAEKLLVSRVRTSKYVVRVSSGLHKMSGNAIAFPIPTPKIYKELPPPRKELDEVLAFIFISPTKPIEKELEKIPFLVSRKKVSDALEWLCLNHKDYDDLIISEENLMSYEDNQIPVTITYQKSDVEEGNKNPESTSVHDCNDEEGVSDGHLKFSVHGLTGEELENLSIDALKAAALAHLKQTYTVPIHKNNNGQSTKTQKGQVLAVGRSKTAESLYNNPSLYPRMFPWLFPYGLGGMGDNKGISDTAWMKARLMYHDKRFQLEGFFPLILNNHEQIRQATTGGFLMTNRKNFDKVVNRVMNIDKNCLLSLSERLNSGEYIIPKTEEEKICYDLINDLDHVSYNVNGSATSKKHMRNEIWSTISYLGAPSWFITFVPADNKNPICFYMADTQLEFKPDLKRTHSEIYRLIANNPVAGARFFHLAVQLFIKHVLGVGSDHHGLFGRTESYYGTVEQQGRLTLQLHLLLWIKNAMSPQQIRDKLMSEDSEFQTKLISYLESCHHGEFLTGSVDEVRAKVKGEENADDHVNPIDCLPSPVPECCSNKCGNCESCKKNKKWWEDLPNVIDEIILRSNVHECNKKCTSDWTKPCKARFPRDIVKETFVDEKTGVIDMKKLEEWINYYCPILSYLLRSNSDITSLLSGTAIKAIVIYITDYITKFPLKTAAMFDTIRFIFNKNQEYLNGDTSREEKSRRLVTQVVNSLTSHLEIGSPMASLYVLGNPDHYTNFTFTVVYWKNYVSYIQHMSDTKSDPVNNPDEDSDDPDKLDNEKVRLLKKGNEIHGYSKMHDYIYRPPVYSDLNLYDWCRLSRKERSKSKKSTPKLNAKTEVREPTPGHDELDIIDDNEDDEEKIHTEDVESQVLEQEFKEVIEESDDELDMFTKNVPAIQVENDKKKWYKFMDEHPQSLTHKVKIVPHSEGHVPNFIPNLPRFDKGDRSYYCCTMLVLFKPWRLGNELKMESQDWDMAFNKHEFTFDQKKLMSYFNVKYECHDARHDFHQQRLAKEKDGSLPTWCENDTVEHYDQEEHTERIIQQLDGDTDGNDIPDEYQIVSKQTIAKNNQMKDMYTILQNSGWSDPSIDGVPYKKNDNPFKIQKNTSKYWSDLLDNKKKQLLAQKLSTMVKKQNPSDEVPKYNDDFEEDQVVIGDEDFLKLNSKMKKTERKTIDDIVLKNTLNEEQDCAFNIVAAHAVKKNPIQLTMYLGGMAGTGKSQVIKSLIEFFCIRKEQYRFVVLAPTGSAAALVHGSTYHSMLGIRDSSGEEDVSKKSLSQVKDRMSGIAYIFIDEISMMSCQDMYRISARLAKIRNNSLDPFGGVNMIFAGDFSQLPPAMNNPPLYSGNIKNRADSSTTIYGQEKSIGKALWHQVTTVVILKKNMRQRTQTDEDAKFRQALENMRYRACTDEDIEFLNSLVAGKGEGQKKLNQKCFRDVSVITGFNIHRDALNYAGAERFAQDTDQELIVFHSMDKAVVVDPTKNRKHKGQTGRRNKVQYAALSPFEQNILWNLPPMMTQHVPGKLELCKGMPVMIKKNEATECCVTNGAEANVFDWDYSIMPNKKNVLNTLFVELKNPPSTIELEGLPTNVVPLRKASTTIDCAMPNGKLKKIQREQPHVLLNFGMTDYASQGRTRPNNVVDLQNCKNHQSYYTALSRSASAKGTIIVQGFDPSTIQDTTKMSGFLRQEFRELEMLNEITRLRYKDELPESVNAKTRYALLRQFKEAKGDHYEPEGVHQAISWKNDQRFKIDGVDPDQWKIIERGKTTTTKEKNTKISTVEPPLKNRHDTNKRKAPASEPLEQICPPSKRLRLQQESNAVQVHNDPQGFIWDSADFSCPYDAALPILWYIWRLSNETQRHEWAIYTINYSRIVMKALRQRMSPEATRDKIRHVLHQQSPTDFPWGHKYASVNDVLTSLLTTSQSLFSKGTKCPTCSNMITSHATTSHVDASVRLFDFQVYLSEHPNDRLSVQNWFEYYFNSVRVRCTPCRTTLLDESIPDVVLHSIPPVLSVCLHTNQIFLDHMISIQDHDEVNHAYQLRGLVYFGGSHFVSRIIDDNYDVWFNDGIITRRKYIKEKALRQFTNEELHYLTINHAVYNSCYAVYAKI